MDIHMMFFFLFRMFFSFLFPWFDFVHIRFLLSFCKEGRDEKNENYFRFRCYMTITKESNLD